MNKAVWCYETHGFKFVPVERKCWYIHTRGKSQKMMIKKKKSNFKEGKDQEMSKRSNVCRLFLSMDHC